LVEEPGHQLVFLDSSAFVGTGPSPPGMSPKGERSAVRPRAPTRGCEQSPQRDRQPFGGLSVALGLSTNLWVFFGFMFLIGLAVPFLSITSMTVLQEAVEPEMQGRVFGFVGIVMAVAVPAGMVVFGPLADRFTVEAVLVASGVVTFLVVAAAVVLPSGRLVMDAAHRARGGVTSH